LAIGTDGLAAKNTAISKSQNGRFKGWLTQENLRKLKREANAGCKKAG
jgi:hypothetical protein